MISKTLLTLCRSNINVLTKRLCIEEFSNEIDEIVDFLKVKIPEKIPCIEDIQCEFTNFLKNNCDVIVINDNRYPKLMKENSFAPVLLSLKGNVDILSENSVAIVGSRKVDAEDFAIIRKFVEIVEELGCNTISGLARGSDIIAHVQSMTTGTIVVLPCGFQYCYPREHKYLLDKVIDFGGVAVSEFPFSEPPRRSNFIKRNSIIASVANAMIIARARTVNCGTMSSANFANKLGKSIYTLVFNGESEGNKFLLKNDKAIEIKSFEYLSYSILADIARNSNKCFEKEKNNNTNLLKKKTSLFMSSNVNYESILDEVRCILSYSENCHKIQKNASSIPSLFEICCEELNLSKKDRIKILKALFEILL